MKNFISKITMKQWIIIAVVVALIIIIILVAQNAKKKGELAQIHTGTGGAVVVNPYVLPGYGQTARVA